MTVKQFLNTRKRAQFPVRLGAKESRMEIQLFTSQLTTKVKGPTGRGLAGRPGCWRECMSPTVCRAETSAPITTRRPAEPETPLAGSFCGCVCTTGAGTCQGGNTGRSYKIGEHLTVLGEGMFIALCYIQKMEYLTAVEGEHLDAQMGDAPGNGETGRELRTGFQEHVNRQLPCKS